MSFFYSRVEGPVGSGVFVCGRMCEEVGMNMVV